MAPKTRHAEMWIEQDTLHLFYSRAEDTPERILVTRIDLLRPWKQWTTTQEEVVLEPERVWEGACLPRQVSRWGAARTPVHQLRDPAIYVEDDDLYLLYGGAGETNLAIARLHLK